MSNRNLKFFRVGLPFFSIIFGGAYGLHYFQQVRFDFRQIKQQDSNLETLRTDLSSAGLSLRDNVTVDSVLKETACIDTESWTNIRGPRESEDNSEYIRINAPIPPGVVENPIDNPPEPLDNPPEPDDAASVRAERGSPTPSCVTLNQRPLLPDPLHLHLVDPPHREEHFVPDVPAPPSSSSASVYVPADPEAQNITVNSELYALLLDNGFDEQSASIALQRTGNAGIDQAVAWILEHSNPSDFDSASSESESDNEDDMGATSSAEPGPSGAPGAPPGISLVQSLMAAAKNSRTHKMVFVANMGLKMGTGKLAAQVGHATLAVYKQAMSSEAGQSAIDSWTRHGQVKIVLKGNSTEELLDLFKTARDLGCYAYLVQDAGYTQIPPGSRTILGVFGEKEQVDAVTGKLRLL